MATPLQDQLHALYALQQIDTQVQKAKRAQATLDNGAQAAQQAQAARDSEAAKRAALHRLSADLKDSELKLSGIETKRKNYQQKLYQGTVTNSRELSNIEREIEALGRQRSDLDDRILELMEQVEQAQAELKVAEEQSHAADSHHADIVARFQSRHEALNLEITEAMRRRAAAVSAVEDKALLKRYEDLRPRHSGLAVVKIEGNDCAGCHMTLPTGVIKSVKEGQQIEACENCGRLLTV
jgi:predicted  nucleic acid-binding Zn-ribbon protein